jgi:hypothetical protein
VGVELRCYKCGGARHRFADCKSTAITWFKCGKIGHRAFECRSKEVICFNCGEAGHFSTKCPKTKKMKSDRKGLL